MTNKKVACLYRVSTKKQIEKEDIPMQKKACQDFISRHEGWESEKEYYEKGVSGYKVSSSDRDVLQTVLKDASNGVFDVLLVFSTDRLGRRSDEYTPIVKQLSHDVEVWSVSQGELTIKTHTDTLKTFVDGWQNEGESIKTSLRIDEKHKQMTEDGVYRGGWVPFGYKKVKSGRYNSRDKDKRKELYDMAIDEDEAEVVREIYELALRGKGGTRIAQALNESGKRTKRGNYWNATTVFKLLKNPTYKGYLSYGKTSSKNGKQRRQDPSTWILSSTQIERLVIVSEDEWDRVNAGMVSRRKKPGRPSEPTTSSKLLLHGLLYCGHCDHKMTSSTQYRNYTYKTGEKKGQSEKKIYYNYRCNCKKDGHICNGKKTCASWKVEEPVIEFVKDYLDSLRVDNVKDDFIRQQKKTAKVLERQVKNKAKECEKIYQDIKNLEEELLKVLTGESPFSRDQLADIMTKKKTDLVTAQDAHKALKENLQVANADIQDVDQLQVVIPVWSEVFDNADIEQKRDMLRAIIDRVDLYVDRVEIKIKLHIDEFMESISDPNDSDNNDEEKCTVKNSKVSIPGNCSARLFDMPRQVSSWSTTIPAVILRQVRRTY